MSANVLVLDDDRFMRTSLVDALGEGNYQSEPFAEGAKALQALTERRFDVAITD